MKRLPILILLITIILLTGCEKKYKPTIIEGYILETGTDKPIEGARVPILFGYNVSGGVSMSPIDTVYTDNNGHFYWKSEEEQTSFDHSWFMAIGVISHEKYWALRWIFSDYQTGIDDEEHYNETMYLDPHAYLHLHVEDVPEVEGSYVRFGGTMFRNQAVELYGESYENVFLVKGNRRDKTRFNFTFKEGPNVSKSDSLLAPAHDTLYYHLKY